MRNFEEFSSLDGGYMNARSEFFYSCKFKNCDFSEIIFPDCTFENCTFDSCNLSNVRLQRTKFFDTTFHECKLLGITWPYSKIPSTFSAHKCIFHFNIFSGYNLDSLSLTDCSFKEAFFQDCSARKCDFTGSDFSDARFENCNLNKAIFNNTSDLFIDPESNNVAGAKIPINTALSMLKKYKLEIC